MTSFLWPSSSLATVSVLILLYCIPASYLGFLSKFYIVCYLIAMLIGYLFSSKPQSGTLPLIANRSSYALVTGASSGIGAEISRLLAERDFNLIMVARSETKLHTLANQLRQMSNKIKIYTISQDLSERNAATSLINKIDALKDVSLDIIINNAGQGGTTPFLQVSAEDNAYEQMIALHIRTPMELIRHYLPQMMNRPSRIVNVSSIVSYMSSPRAAVYASTKSFLTQFTTALNYEVEQLNGNKNVSLLLVAPGPTLNTGFDRHDESVIFRLPFVNLTAEEVARQIVDACLRGDQFCTPGWANQLSVWLVNKLPLSFSHIICWLLWASWPELKQWLYERRHLVIVCFNLAFFLFLLACFIFVGTFRQLYYRFF